ncbi:hypothetical protein HAX54_038144 [Datura stramonium]|uniref:Uncharacterized protein n=1 Tax=Datura stramonium TaxID=4076 RepID=A0ABS8VNC6_DATST|nr:hypothetical protein [Datura stramonium]
MNSIFWEDKINFGDRVYHKGSQQGGPPGWITHIIANGHPHGPPGLWTEDEAVGMNNPSIRHIALTQDRLRDQMRGIALSRTPACATRPLCRAIPCARHRSPRMTECAMQHVFAR